MNGEHQRHVVRARGADGDGVAAASSGALQAFGDAPDARQQCLEQVAVLARCRRASACSRSTCIRFIGSTYGLRSRIERCRVGSESSSSRLSLIASTCSQARWYSARMASPMPRSAFRGQRFVVARDLQVGARQHGLDIVDEVPEEEPAGVGFAHACQPERLPRRRQGRCRRRTSRASCSAPATRRTPTAPAAAPSSPALALRCTEREPICMRSMTSMRRHRLEELVELRGLVDQAAVGVAALARQALRELQVRCASRPRPGRRAPRRWRGSGR